MTFWENPTFFIVDAEIRGLFTKLVYNTHHIVGIPSTVGLLEISNKFLHITRYSILTIENLESFSNRRFMVCRRTWRQRLHSHRRRCAVFSRGSPDLSPPALRTLRRPSAAAITKADNTGCVTTGTANTTKIQNVAIIKGGPRALLVKETESRRIRRLS